MRGYETLKKELTTMIVRHYESPIFHWHQGSIPLRVNPLTPNDL
jgi:hypothetical protein